MTIYTVDRLGNEVLTTKDLYTMLLGAVFEDGGVKRLEKAICNTYVKDDANQIIFKLNQGLRILVDRQDA